MNLGFLLLEATADIGGSMSWDTPLGERLLQGITTLLFGMIVVFSVLSLLWGILELFRVIFYHPNKKKEPEKQTEPIPAKAEISSSNDEELTAAITAAVYAYLSENSESGVVPSFRVVSFKKH